jgi:threonine synthase
VPTGNFGNILAGYYAKLMGLPINRLICASNRNNVLTEFIRTGSYDRNRPFYKSISPSMDILVSSNLERLLYHVSGGNTEVVASWMQQLNESGKYTIDRHSLQVIQELFWADWVDDQQSMATMRQVYENHRYVLDPHTAVAWQVYDNYRHQTGDKAPSVIVSTASPFKFNSSVLGALTTKALVANDEFGMLQELAGLTAWPIPAKLAALESEPIRHHLVCDKTVLGQLVTDLLIKK